MLIPLSKSRSYKNKYFKQLVAVRHLHYFSLGVNCFKTLELWIGVPARNFCGSVCKNMAVILADPICSELLLRFQRVKVIKYSILITICEKTYVFYPALWGSSFSCVFQLISSKSQKSRPT
jgi:hypothetical protein